MGGQPQQPKASDYIPRPDNTIPMAMMGMQSALGQQALANQNKLMGEVSSIPKTAQTPDIYGDAGQLAQANKMAVVNAYNSKKLEELQNPTAAATRNAIVGSAAQDVTPGYWQNTMNQWSQQHGLMG
jgi:hypothetical protein